MNPAQHGPWTILQTHEVYADPWIHVRRDDVLRPDGRPGTHSVIRIKPGVTVLALDGERRVHLTSEFHYAVGRVTLEAVSGGSDPGETPLASAQRELREELGLAANDWLDLGRVDPFTTNVISPTQLFLARGLSPTASAPEGTELIQAVTLPLDEAYRQVMHSEITHAPTCVAILKTWLLLNGADL